ncbi:MAG: hypothetical protein AB8G99_10700 [Planctomycetaceae bacterium]
MFATKLIAIFFAVLAANFWVRWWMWPGYYQWLGRTWPRVFAPELKAQIQPQENAIKRALSRHEKATGEATKFVRVVRAPFWLFLSRYSLWKRVAWGLVKNGDGRECLVCVRGWYLSDAAMPEFFER